jgi:hypothetical protein
MSDSNTLEIASPSIRRLHQLLQEESDLLNIAVEAKESLQGL